jgi:mannose-6-phosphate isomerase-like protein (cupin superfamily)
MDTARSVFMHIPGNGGEGLQVTGGIVTCKLSGVETGATYSLWEAVTASGKGPRPHRHHGQDEDFYVLEGQVQFSSGDETVTVSEGDFVRVPPEQSFPSPTAGA